MYPVLTKHFSELSTREYHRIVQAREAVFFLEQHITEPDADAIDPQSVFMWMEDGGRVVAFLRIIPAGSPTPKPRSAACWSMLHTAAAGCAAA